MGSATGVWVGTGVGVVREELMKMTHFGLSAPTPAVLRARTCQAMDPSAREGVVQEVPVCQGLVMAPSLMTTWYSVAPLTAFHVKVALGPVPVRWVPLAGPVRTGAAGGVALPTWTLVE